MNKKAIAILGAIFILIVGTLGFLIYTKYAGKNTTAASNPVATTTPAPITATNATSTPTAQVTPKIVRLTQTPVISPTLFFDGTGVTYFGVDGELYQATLQNNNGALQLGSPKNLNIQTRPNISKILWPKTGQNFIAEFDQGTTTTWSFYNSQAGTYTDLPPQVGAVDWFASGDKILYTWIAQDKGSLNMGDPTLKTYQHISDLFETDDAINLSPNSVSV